METGWISKRPRSRRSLHTSLPTGKLLCIQEGYEGESDPASGLPWLRVDLEELWLTLLSIKLTMGVMGVLGLPSMAVCHWVVYLAS